MKKQENRIIIFRIPTLKQIGAQLKHNRKLRNTGKAAADSAIASGIFSFTETAKKMRRHHWVTGYAFFMRLFDSCKTLPEAKSALAAFDLHPPKCPWPIMFTFRQVESEMMERVS